MKGIILNLMLVSLILGLFTMMPSIVVAQGTAVSVIPLSQNVSLGSSVTVNITITNAVNLAGFEFKLFWSNTILNISRIRVFLPWSPNFVPRNETLQNFNSTHGRYWLGAAALPPTPFTGNTTVVMATFKAIKEGISPLVLIETKLGDIDGQPILHTAVNGEVTVGLARDTAITLVIVSPTTVVPGGMVDINVTAANLGDARETFTVTGFYDSTAIDTETVTDLAAGSSVVLAFVWNTTGVAVGSYTISANATLALGDVDATNNNKVFTPDIAVQKATSTISILTSRATVAVGENVTISGAIAPVRANVDATIEVRVGSGMWTTLTTVRTNATGKYSYVWKPDTANSYDVRSDWQGDATTNSATSTTTRVRVRYPGDVNFDGIVDVYDLITLGLHFGHVPPDGHAFGTGEYTVCLEADLNGDNVIDLYDLITVATHYGESSP